MTVFTEVLKQNILLLKNKGIVSAERDALTLLSFALDFGDNQHNVSQDRQISNIERENINYLVCRRAKNEPVAKIIGKKLFWNSSFYVDCNVLDPRPETEVLVESVLSNIGKFKTILDLGTGTGCVAISLALVLDKVAVAASDLSQKALSIARRNAEENSASVEFIFSNWFEGVSKKFDVIVSNPPYVSKNDFLNLPKDVKFYDPEVALVGGWDGLECYRDIAKVLPLYMSDGGLAFFEIGCRQRKQVVEIFSECGLSLFKVWKDLNGLERVICVKKDA